jgi:hypothetical protein
MQEDSKQQVLLCSDLDRTILPNGPQPESPLARPLLRALAERQDVTLAYVSGRDVSLLQQAITDYQIPLPEYAIGDVGSTIYRIDGGNWRIWSDWHDTIASDWHGRQAADLMTCLRDLEVLQLQEPEKQSRFKLSYYTPVKLDVAALTAETDARLSGQGIRATAIWSIDEAAGTGLLDIVPTSATKLGAIRFLMEHAGFGCHQTVFAGDSGNDLPVLVSEIPAVLVRNADEHVRGELAAMLEGRNTETVYAAQGDFLGMNGYYSAGVLEGLVHYQPHLRPWLEGQADSLTSAR